MVDWLLARIFTLAHRYITWYDTREYERWLDGLTFEGEEGR